MKRLLLAALLVAPLFASASALAETPQHLVDSATLTLEDMMGGSPGTQAQQFLQKARAVVICPRIFRGAFFFGGEGGGCVMAARGASGTWSNPAFFTIGSGSFGLQIGVQDAEVMMLVMTDNGLNALLNSHVKLGADAGLSIAVIGAGVNGSMSTGLKADILTISKSRGLYGGISVAGSVFGSDTGTDRDYYGTALDARQIVVDMQGTNAGANPLRAMLAKYGG